MSTTAAIAEVSPREAIALVRGGAVLVDVREPDETALGSPTGARRIPLGRVVAQLVSEAAERQSTLVTICGTGRRSLRAAEALREVGFSDVRSVAGGFVRWRKDGLPEESVSALPPDARERYSRHILLPGVGEAGQLRLRAARVVVVGAGGLGSPAAFYLAAAGVGRLRLVDHDVVDRSNLQRQILHTDRGVGSPKVASAAERLRALNPEVDVETRQQRVTAANVEATIADADVVIDGSDNFPTRYLVNEACVRLGKPLVYGAVHRFEGQVSVFWPAHPSNRMPCYRCLFPEPPSAEDAPNCAEAGVLGVLPGLIGTAQATEAVKLIVGIGEPLLGRLLHLDALAMRFREVRLPRDPACPGCGPRAKRKGPYQSYEEICAAH
ncbi:MAG TPA: molybdopterin-synthase adenylyltransferase MoeB [Xanthomonadales bacterium]|nr:molybdopterin-synthase adenylyltransferase MoeB [Xanthomonadales bacterium]